MTQKRVLEEEKKSLEEENEFWDEDDFSGQLDIYYIQHKKQKNKKKIDMLNNKIYDIKTDTEKYKKLFEMNIYNSKELGEFIHLKDSLLNDEIEKIECKLKFLLKQIQNKYVNKEKINENIKKLENKKLILNEIINIRNKQDDKIIEEDENVIHLDDSEDEFKMNEKKKEDEVKMNEKNKSTEKYEFKMHETATLIEDEIKMNETNEIAVLIEEDEDEYDEDLIKEAHDLMNKIYKRVDYLNRKRTEVLSEMENMLNYIVKKYDEWLSIHPKEPLLKRTRFENDIYFEIKNMIDMDENFEFFDKYTSQDPEIYNFEFNNKNQNLIAMKEYLDVKEDKEIFEAILRTFVVGKETFLQLKGFISLGLKDYDQNQLKRLESLADRANWFSLYGFGIKQCYLYLKYETP